MTTFESAIKPLAASSQTVYTMLNDLRNLEKIRDRIPKDKISEVTFSEDEVMFKIDPVGNVGIKIIERDEPSCIKFAALKSPVDFKLWIQLKEVSENDTRLKITLKADLNPMIKMMATKPLQGFVDTLANSIASFDFTV